MPKIGIAVSRGRWIHNILRNHHIDFKSVCTSLHSNQQWRGVLLTLHFLQHKLSLVFLILAILTGVRWYLGVVLIYISLIVKDVEQLSLSAIWHSAFNWIIWYFDVYFLMSSLYILEIKPLSEVELEKIFSHSVGCHFALLTVSFAL